MKFCYLKRERYGSKQKLLWRVTNATSGEYVILPGAPSAFRLKQGAVYHATDCGYTILPDGMTPEQWHHLRSWKERRPHCWRQELLDLWATGRDESVPWMRQLRNNLGPKGLMKFKF